MPGSGRRNISSGVAKIWIGCASYPCPSTTSSSASCLQLRREPNQPSSSASSSTKKNHRNTMSQRTILTVLLRGLMSFVVNRTWRRPRRKFSQVELISTTLQSAGAREGGRQTLGQPSPNQFFPSWCGATTRSLGHILTSHRPEHDDHRKITRPPPGRIDDDQTCL